MLKIFFVYIKFKSDIYGPLALFWRLFLEQNTIAQANLLEKNEYNRDLGQYQILIKSMVLKSQRIKLLYLQTRSKIKMQKQLQEVQKKKYKTIFIGCLGILIHLAIVLTVLVYQIPHQDSPNSCDKDKFSYRKQYLCTTIYGQCTTNVAHCDFNAQACVYGKQRSWLNLFDFIHGEYCVTKETAEFNQVWFFKRLWPYTLIFCIFTFYKMFIWITKSMDKHFEQEQKIKEQYQSKNKME